MSTYVYRHDIDPHPEGDRFWSVFGAIRTPIVKGLLPHRTAWPFLRYVRAKHTSFEHVLEVCQVRELIQLSTDRGVAERWASQITHEDLSGEPISFTSAEFHDIILADVVCVTALYEYDVSGAPCRFRIQHFLFPGDARFDLMRLLAIGDPDRLDRAELSSVHAELLSQAEDWSC